MKTTAITARWKAEWVIDLTVYFLWCCNLILEKSGFTQNIGGNFGQVAVNSWNIWKKFMKMVITVAICLECGYNFVTDTFAADG